MRPKSILRLSESDARLLLAIEHRAGQPFSAIAKILSAREHTVRYRVHALKRRGVVIEKVPFIDMYALGYSVFKIYCELQTNDSRQKAALFEYLRELPQVLWMAHLGGDYQFVFSLCVKRTADMYQVLHALSLKFGSIVSVKDLLVQVKFAAFGRKYLASKSLAGSVLKFGIDSPSTFKPDQMDHTILAGLCTRGDMTESQLAQELKIPHSTFLRRLKILQTEKVLLGQVYRLNSSSIGLHRFNLFVSVREFSSELFNHMYSFCAKHPRIVNLGECIGPWQFELAVDVEQPFEVVEIGRELSERFGSQVSLMKTLSIYKSDKYTSYPA